MKKIRRVLTVTLVMILVGACLPASAAPGNSSMNSGVFSFHNRWGNFWDKLLGNTKDTSENVTDPTESDSVIMTLLEDETTVTENTELRASTYALTSADEAGEPVTTADGETIIKYFPVTLYDYDKDTFNQALHKIEVDAALASEGGISSLTEWNGIYFGNGAGTDSYTYSTGGSHTSSTVSLEFADHNKWTGDLEGNNGNRIYSGMAQDKLDANNNILFNYPDGGLFNSDTAVKDIYTNVSLPFEYDSSTGYYDFDANRFGVYFHTDSTQGTTAVPASNTKLYYSATPQSHNFNGQDKRTRGWFPYDDTTNVDTNTANYYFGMNASIPFTMTANGCMNANDDNSDPIKFTFSGDDDVWVYIDGQLVLDIGGDRNGMNATLDFSTNTWEITEMTTLTGKPAGDVNGGPLSGKIFNDDEGTGKLNQTIETFASTDAHTLTIFYLERGGGSSNCQIKFNLPMKDTVSVTKRAAQSISSDGEVSPLTAKEQETVNNIDFGFILTKNGEPVANTNYNVLDINGNPLEIRSTDADGHFTLRNGQTARFVGDIAADGAEYQVSEDEVETKGFKLPTYSYGGTAAGGYMVSSSYYDQGTEIPVTEENLTSAAVTAKGSAEAEDSLQFICENYFDANLPNPSSRPVDDMIVIDYGLPVEIDALSNDVYRGDAIELTEVTGARYGTATIENGKITYQLTKQLTGVEVLTYTAKVTGSGNSGNDTTIDSESRTAKIYIMPATSMYYEENFSDLVTFSGSWEEKGTAQTEPQEPGVVGTVGDSPYGSDTAYLNDSGDSNGSSKYVNTANGSAAFCYTFTGTGTSFFARTGTNTATMRIKITDENGKQVAYLNRNTKYTSVEGTDVGTLYNIPVYTEEGLDYGTYTVEVTVLKAVQALDYGSEFYLDGIRVINPLDREDTNASAANAAYATDGEANMTIATLRQKLLRESDINEDGTLSWDGTNFVVFTDSNGEITAAEDYKSNGPKEEVYLNRAQGVSFSLYDWDANTNRIYLGIKAPVGSGSISINANTLNINNATDCYYDVTKYADIKTDENGVKTAFFQVQSTSSLISVTNIKVTGNAEFTIVNE